MNMSDMERITLRLSPVQLRQVNRLSAKLQLDTQNVIRLAITRLAESEGIFITGKK